MKQTTKHAGPTFRDTINARKLTLLLRRDSDLEAWVLEKLETAEGRRDLAVLIAVAREARKK